MNNDVYQTSDLGIAASLACLGYQITGIDRNDPRRIVFLFQRDEQLDSCLEGYWNGTLRLPPASLFMHQKGLKQRIYEQDHA